MSARTPIQVPIELKMKMDDMKGTLKASSQYEVIEKLIEYYNRAEQQKNIEFKFRQAEKKEQDETMVVLGEELKKKYDLFQRGCSFNYPQSGLKLLLEHWESSDSFKRGVLELLKELR